MTTFPRQANRLTDRSADLQYLYRLRFGALAWMRYVPGIPFANLGWTQTRAGNGTFYDSTGTVQTASANTLRDNHWLLPRPYAHSLYEVAATNSVLWSEDLTQAAWSLGGNVQGISANAVTAPDGTLTADGVIGKNLTASMPVVQAFGTSWTASTRQSYGHFLRPGNKTWCYIRFDDKAGATSTVFFNLATGAVGSSAGASPPVGMIWPVAQGFFRCEALLPSSGTGALTVDVGFGFCDADASVNCTGDGTTVNGYAWGGHHEIDQPWVTSYIPTTTTAVSRAGDAWTMPHRSFIQPRAMYLAYTETGNQKYANGGLSLFQIGANSERFTIGTYNGGLTNYGMLAYHYVGGTPSSFSGSGVSTPNAFLGDSIEVRAGIGWDWTTYRGMTMNRGTEDVLGGTFFFVPATTVFGSPNYQILARSLALVAFKDCPGGPYSLDLLRRS